MSQLKLSLLGTPQIELDESPVELDTRKALALLVYLAMNGKSQSRDALATLFWPENNQSQGRTYLRRALWMLKSALGEEHLLIDRQNVGLNHQSNLWIDAIQFRQLRASSEQREQTLSSNREDCLAPLADAVNLYQGDFLAGFTLPDAPDFDDWQFFQADSLRQEMAAVLETLVQGYKDLADYETAVTYARRWVNFDPLHELAQRELMQLYGLTGQQAAALRQYETCVRMLSDEFGLPPEPETTAIYEAIKHNRSDKPTAAPVKSDKFETGSITTAKMPPPPFLTTEDEAELSPIFVARDRELTQLKSALDTTLTSQGQILFLIGGAGRGKTLLTQEFARQAQAENEELIVVSGHCDAMTGVGDPYLPFREALTMLTGDVEAKWAGGLVPQVQAKRLWELMPETLPSLVQHAPDLIGNFVPSTPLQARSAAVASPETPWLTEMNRLIVAERSSGLEQQRIFSQYTAYLKAIAAKRPLLLIIEDLHWVDTASSGLLFHLSREISDSRILILGTYRPEEVPLSWSNDRHPLASLVSELKRQHGDIWLDMDDLMAVDGRHFVDAYLDSQPNQLDESFRAALFQHTGGYALFTVELLRDMQDRGDLILDDNGNWVVAKTIDWQTLPIRVEGVIEKRIKRLDQKWQDALTIASIEGETFTAEVVARVQELSERNLVQQLSRELDKRHRLVKAQSIERVGPQVGTQRLSRYRFRHHLFQHYLYYAIDELEREYLHETVGNTLEELYQNRTADVAVQLAWHFQEAGLFVKAIHYLKIAGDTAACIYAHTEAITSYRKALSLIEEYAVGHEHLIPLYNSLGRTLELSSRFDEALDVYQEMALVARKLEHRQMELSSLMAQVTLYATPTPVHDPAKGPALGQETLALARELGDKAAEAKTLWNLALGGMWSGRTHQGIAYAEQAVSLARKLDQTELLAYALNDLGMLYAAVLDVNQAIPTLQEAGKVWRQLDNLPMLSDNISMIAMAHVAAGDYQDAIERSNEAFQLSESHNNLWGKSYSRMMVGLAYWELGNPDKALAMADESLHLGKQAGFMASQLLAGGFKASFLGTLGAIEQGIMVAEEAVQIAKAQFPHFCCHPLGVLIQLHLMAGNLSEAESLVEMAADDAYREAHPTWNMRINLAEAELALKQQDYAKAIAIANRWLPQLRQNNLKSFTPAMLQLKGEALLALGEIEAARENFLAAKNMTEATGAQMTLWSILSTLCQLESDRSLAQDWHQQAHDIVDAIASRISNADLRDSFLAQAHEQKVFV